MKILAVTSADPVEGVDAPTLKSLGVDMEFTNWRGIVGPPGLSDAKKQEYVDLLTKMHDSSSGRRPSTTRAGPTPSRPATSSRPHGGERPRGGVLTELGLA